MITFIAQLTVGIIFNDGYPVTVCKLDQFLAPLQAESGTARVLEVRKHVNKLWPDTKRGLQLIHDHAILVCSDRDVLSAIGIPSLQRSQIRRRFDHDVIAAVKEQPSNKIQ